MIMRYIVLGLIVLCILGAMLSITGCKKDYTHPCNFPDEFTASTFRDRLSYKIIDESTLTNLVDTSKTASIHLDSVYLLTASLDTIPTKYDYYIDNWAFQNFYAYYGVSVDPQELLGLSHRVFYLRTSYDDLDTIDVYFNQCLIEKVLFNKKSTEVAFDEPYEGSTSLYFRK